MAQSANDQVWLGQLHEEMGARVEHINAHAVKMVGARPSIDAIREDARKRGTADRQPLCAGHSRDQPTGNW